jgi:CPA2 family monovalent cation:H+ antiporter-2
VGRRPRATAGAVLVATDGRSEDDAALRAANLIATDRGVTLNVLSVVPMIPVVAPEMQVPGLADSMAAARAAVLSRVRAQLRRVLGTEAIPLELGVGAPAPVIARRARELGASLIIVGLGRHTVADRLFGSETALRLLHVASTPILAVPPLFATMPRRAIAALDFSPGSIAALRLAQPFQSAGASVTAAYVVTSDLAASMGEVSGDRLGQILEVSFTQVRDELALRDGVTFETRVLHGDPVNQILSCAEETGADLIIIGSHGRGFISRTLLGSVAIGVMRGAKCAVFAVPYAAARAAGRSASDVLHVPRREWATALDDFSNRNAGCPASLELDDPEFGAQVLDVRYPFVGVTFDRHDARVEIMLGELGAGRRHVTRSIGDVSSIDILRRTDGRDSALRVGHGAGQTLLTLSC